jgi:glyoxylase-like metal-dependent hydrolase (beta-lactamase superfamily II)
VLTVGDAKLTILNGGNFRLDGGAMHGVVPKTLWSKLVSCDALNRCEYATRCVVVEAAGKRLLIETGNGDKFSPKLKDIYGINHDRSIEHALREVGLQPDDIDFVVMTHMHFDHSGGATRYSTTGSGLAPVFRRARHVVQRKEWKDAVKPHERNRASYLQENVAPLAERGGELLWLVDGETEIVPGVRVIPTPGHTAGHQSLLVRAGAEAGADSALLVGDACYLSSMLAGDVLPPFAFDAERQRGSYEVLRRHERDGARLLFSHDVDHWDRVPASLSA